MKTFVEVLRFRERPSSRARDNHFRDVSALYVVESSMVSHGWEHRFCARVALECFRMIKNCWGRIMIMSEPTERSITFEVDQVLHHDAEHRASKAIRKTMTMEAIAWATRLPYLDFAFRVENKTTLRLRISDARAVDRRRTCGAVAVILLAKSVLPALNKDMRVMLAAMVWEKRLADEWDPRTMAATSKARKVVVEEEEDSSFDLAEESADESGSDGYE